jgi:hypothetical protein
MSITKNVLPILLAVAGSALLAALPAGAQDKPVGQEEKTVGDRAGLQTKYVKLKTTLYTLELPAGWEAGAETPFGQREIKPVRATDTAKPAEKSVAKGAIKGDEGQSLGVMSAMSAQGLATSSWDQLYKTSLFYITRSDRSDKIKATPYKLSKTKLGLESCSWTMQDAEGVSHARYTILKSPKGPILALSVKFPNRESQKRLDAYFQHVVDTALFN